MEQAITAPAVQSAERQSIRIEQHSAVGLIWFAGWLFTLGLLHLPFWRGLLALLIWPYYLGASWAKLMS